MHKWTLNFDITEKNCFIFCSAKIKLLSYKIIRLKISGLLTQYDFTRILEKQLIFNYCCCSTSVKVRIIFNFNFRAICDWPNSSVLHMCSSFLGNRRYYKALIIANVNSKSWFFTVTDHFTPWKVLLWTVISRSVIPTFELLLFRFPSAQASFRNKVRILLNFMLFCARNISNRLLFFCLCEIFSLCLHDIRKNFRHFILYFAEISRVLSFELKTITS